MSSDDTRPDKPDRFSALSQTHGDQDLADLARSNGLSEAAADAVAAIDAVLNKVRRSIQRRDFGRLILARIDPSLEVSHLDVIIAIAHNPAVGDTPQDEVTVGNIAERLGIDPSRASRISADIVERGYALRVASQLDARRICLRLTARGERLVTAVRQTKWRIFAESLAQWDEQELVTFARLLERFAGWATDEASMRRSADAVKQMMDEAEPV
ncbi:MULTISPECIES: MarR family winged helix-turn-helix transcriptional regulator [Mesorhizobium]|uniref:Winged helix-turn-helix transcriptional regulator n=1 Tax=Mesorhizobium japonicum R7A TaxID=935547 RepID=A0ABX6MZT4_9HYPH|nr:MULTISPECIES: MarR family winged helix-turn-helix transcriptional regulator [Mesorhizobium]ETA71447.1 transcriptional regulator [Mesorhizobium japonicum R7A]MBE1708279.1 winged helix-turn-helix transcriptional regulator [Mesorhizobium japonicum]MBE1713448.1 winged helix-turn-helix transcriptional regulator [Mesorhizobium japonicum]MUT19597.1 MarR family transcriptional regulator [Mesorhizobium japonicum]MUT25567.1 MarR family transcriptional regulator [Mesorhizobium japonicum]